MFESSIKFIEAKKELGSQDLLTLAVYYEGMARTEQNLNKKALYLNNSAAMRNRVQKMGNKGNKDK